MTKATTKILKQKLTHKKMLSMVKRNTETVCVVGVIVEQERGREGTGKKGHCHWVTVLLHMLWRPAGPLLLNWKEIVQKTLEPSLPHHHHHQRRHYHHYCLGCFKCLSKVASGTGTGTGTWRICCIFAWLWTFASGKSNGMWQLWPPWYHVENLLQTWVQSQLKVKLHGELCWS